MGLAQVLHCKRNGKRMVEQRSWTDPSNPISGFNMTKNLLKVPRLPRLAKGNVLQVDAHNWAVLQRGHVYFTLIPKCPEGGFLVFSKLAEL
jgi:hypothetical protein